MGYAKAVGKRNISSGLFKIDDKAYVPQTQVITEITYSFSTVAQKMSCASTIGQRPP